MFDIAETTPIALQAQQMLGTPIPHLEFSGRILMSMMRWEYYGTCEAWHLWRNERTYEASAYYVMWDRHADDKEFSPGWKTQEPTIVTAYHTPSYAKSEYWLSLILGAIPSQMPPVGIALKELLSLKLYLPLGELAYSWAAGTEGWENLSTQFYDVFYWLVTSPRL